MAWKLVGGMNKKHPTADEIQGAKDFFAALERKASALDEVEKSNG